MFPLLVIMYLRLARREEKESLAEFAEMYETYAAQTPAFLPRLFPAGINQNSGLYLTVLGGRIFSTPKERGLILLRI